MAKFQTIKNDNEFAYTMTSVSNLQKFGFEQVLVDVTIPYFQVKDDKQTYLNDVPFLCPMSKDTWQSQTLHDARCQYKFCKKGWDFQHR